MKQESLDFIRSELAEYLLQDRFQSAAVILSEGRPNSAPGSIILRNLVRRAIVDGAATAAQAFADCITGTSCSYSEYYAVAGLIVNKEIEVFDGAWLIPLSSSADRLPPYLPTDFSSVFIRRPGEMDYGRPWARTLVIATVPIRHSPDRTTFPGYSSRRDAANYNLAFQGRQMRPDSLKFLLPWTNHRPAKRKISKPLVYDQVSSLGSPFALYDPVTVINPDAPKVD